jgi:hypothetical protein
MVADTLEELHIFTSLIGVKRHFFINQKRVGTMISPVTSDQHVIALVNGAKLVTSRVVLDKAKSITPPL